VRFVHLVLQVGVFWRELKKCFLQLLLQRIHNTSYKSLNTTNANVWVGNEKDTTKDDLSCEKAKKPVISEPSIKQIA